MNDFPSAFMRTELGRMLRNQMRMTPAQRMVSLWFSVDDPQTLVDAINAHLEDREPRRRLVIKTESS